MTDFRRQFVEESICRLGTARKRLAGGDPAAVAELFRVAHTVKGGARIFGLRRAAGLAAELEDRLDAAGADIDVAQAAAFAERIEDALASGDDHPAEDPVEAASGADDGRRTVAFTRLPYEIVAGLSGSERRAVSAAIRRGDRIAAADASIRQSNFAEEFIGARRKLDRDGEIIASIPQGGRDGDGTISFRFIVALDAARAAGFASADWDGFGFYDAAPNDAPELAEMLDGIAAHVGEIGAEAGKSVSFAAIAHPVSGLNSGEVFVVLLHLVRNAVAHAVVARGAIEVTLLEDDAGEVHVTVSDNGNGIDFEKVRRRAADLGLVTDAASLDDAQTAALMFSPRLSTASSVDGVAGRGVGLDAVGQAVRNLGGRIDVSSPGVGTAFEITFPKA